MKEYICLIQDFDHHYIVYANSQDEAMNILWHIINYSLRITGIDVEKLTLVLENLTNIAKCISI